MKRLGTTAILAILVGVGGWSTREVYTQTSSCRVTTISGDAQGTDNGTSCAFLGIPFAAPPIGSLRWTRPQPATPWAPAVLNATVAPSSCAALNAATGLPSGAEDCLKLNVWTPDPLPASGAPVIVWLHPGSFTNASANFPSQNGARLAALTGAIVVAPNYRLGPFGFLGHAALAAEDGAAGNYGLLDQRAALVWVRDHIAAFGGNPDNVTIAGQSAGAHSVSLHLVSPASAGLFHRAILQSGYASFRWRTAEDARIQGDDFAAAIGCTDPDASVLLSCLRSKTRNEVLLARPPALAEQFVETGRTQWTPVVDGVEVPDQPRLLYEQGAFSRVPVLLGANRDEGWTFVQRSFPIDITVPQYEAAIETEFGPYASDVLAAYPASAFASPKDALARIVGDVEYICEARRIARSIERTKTPVFLYSFEHEVDSVVLDRVVHGLDVNFVFGNNFGPPLFADYVLSPADLAFSQEVSGYWTRFARTGNPNADDVAVIHWPAFSRPAGSGRGVDKYLVLDTPIHENQRIQERQCDFWEPHLLRSVTGSVPAGTQF
jgi:para-nitrobenzyl esterase